MATTGVATLATKQLAEQLCLAEDSDDDDLEVFLAKSREKHLKAVPDQINSLASPQVRTQVSLLDFEKVNVFYQDISVYFEQIKHILGPNSQLSFLFRHSSAMIAALEDKTVFERFHLTRAPLHEDILRALFILSVVGHERLSELSHNLLYEYCDSNSFSPRFDDVELSLMYFGLLRKRPCPILSEMTQEVESYLHQNKSNYSSHNFCIKPDCFISKQQRLERFLKLVQRCFSFGTFLLRTQKEIHADELSKLLQLFFFIAADANVHKCGSLYCVRIMSAMCARFSEALVDVDVVRKAFLEPNFIGTNNVFGFATSFLSIIEFGASCLWFKSMLCDVVVQKKLLLTSTESQINEPSDHAVYIIDSAKFIQQSKMNMGIEYISSWLTIVRCMLAVEGNMYAREQQDQIVFLSVGVKTLFLETYANSFANHIKSQVDQIETICKVYAESDIPP